MASIDSPEFDPWCLTDPDSRGRWKADPQAQDSIRQLWTNDPDPGATLRIQAEIDHAYSQGDIGYATDGHGARIGHYFCCPSSTIYVVRHLANIGGRRLHALEEFTFVRSQHRTALSVISAVMPGAAHPPSEPKVWKLKAFVTADAGALSSLTVGVGYRSKVEPRDAAEVGGVDREDREVVGDRSGGDHGVVGPGLDLAARAAK